LTLPRIVGALLVLAVFVAAGGVVAVVVGDAVQPKHAIAYGLGWQGFIGGLLRARSAAVSDLPEGPPAS
jgi:hypothetical protein